MPTERRNGYEEERDTVISTEMSRQQENQNIFDREEPPFAPVEERNPGTDLPILKRI